MDSGEIEQRECLYVGGAWRSPAVSQGSFDVIDSRTEQAMARVVTGGVEDANRAVAAARGAQHAWAMTPARERADLLRRVADHLERRGDALALTIAREVGTPAHVGINAQVGFPISLLRFAADLAEEYRFEERIGTSLVIKEAAGVVTCITPWNFPLTQVLSKVASALAVGCAVVVKPSCEAPLSVFALADAVDEAGVPDGVFNLVTGPGPGVGEALVAHPQVDMVSFTGSTEVGRHIGALAAQGVKRVALELGGKSPNVLLDDVDVARAVGDGLGRAFLNSGQTCSALTRMLVPRVRLREFEEAAVAAVEAMKVGDPLDGDTVIGPLVSAAQRDRVRSYIAAGSAEGAKLLVGGANPPNGLQVGYYVEPTVFSEVSNDMVIAREEIFGPVLCILPYDGEDDAVQIANDTVYGLAAGVWSGDRDRAEAIARRLTAGQVNVNGGAFNPVAPFGGFKQSGYGRERGSFGLEEFLEVKSLQF